MGDCIDLGRKKRKICIGDLKYSVGIYDRDISGGLSQTNQAHSETYTLLTSVFVSIETKSSIITQTFDGVVIEPDLVITHIFITRYLATITTEQFIVYAGLVYKIVTAENVNEEGDWLRLKANFRGTFTKPGAQ